MSDATLTLGSSGGPVASLHQLLNEQGFDCGEDAFAEPRVFGHETLEAVTLFQASHVGLDLHHLAVDGVVGPKTWWALRHASGEHQGGLQPLPDMPSQEPSNALAAAALESAWAELRKGVREVPDGSNRGPEVDLYTGMVGEPPALAGPPWCAYFVSWNFARAPGGSPFGKIGGALTLVTYCQKHLPGSVLDVWDPGNRIIRDWEGYRKEVAAKIKPGDVGVIASGPVHGHVVHVAAVLDGSVWTVEGNSGNAVRARKRPASSFRWFVNFDAYAESHSSPKV